MELTRNRAIELIHSTAIELYGKMRELEENYRSNPASVNYQILEITKYSNGLKDVIDRMTTFNEFDFLDNEGLETFLGMCRNVAQKFSLKIEPCLTEDFTVVEPFTVDGNVIYCHEVAGLSDAIKYFKENPQIRRIVLKGDRRGLDITFNSEKAVKKFLRLEVIKSILAGADEIATIIEDILSPLITSSSTVYVILNPNDDENFLPRFGKINKKLSIFGAAMDFIQVFNRRDFDTAADFVIDLIGIFGGPEGAIISLGLSFAKPGIKKLPYAAAKLSAEMERRIVNRVFQSLSGTNIK